MGLFRQILKVIEYKDTSNDSIVYQYQMNDRDEIMNGCQLIVRESQVAILVSSGQIGDVYGPGSHKLTTGNMPIITKLASWKYGFDSPFKCDVYFINTKQFFDLKWGTSSPIMMRDADFGPIRIRARGTYSFKVDDAVTLMREIFGTNRDYKTSSLEEYFKSMIVSNFADVIGESKIPALDIASKYQEIGELLIEKNNEKFKNFGIKICNVVVEAITLPEEVEKALDERTSIGIMSDKMGSYTQYQVAQAMREAARNEGGGFAGAGIGLGAGMGLGQMMGNAMANAQDAPAPKPSSACPNCGAQIPSGSKFCPECGNKLPQAKFCPECGAKITEGAKFCPECGKKIN